MSQDPASSAIPDAEELARTVGVLLATQQELIDLRHVRDRERRVLDGIVAFSARALSLEPGPSFWRSVTEACVGAFDCEGSFVVDLGEGVPTLLASFGPCPTSASDLDPLLGVLRLAHRSGATWLHGEGLSSLPMRPAQGSVLLARADLEGAPGRRLLGVSVSLKKQAFFPPLDAVSLPALRMFGAFVAAQHEMGLARRRVALQLLALDDSHRALADSEAKYRHLFEDSSDGMALLDPDGALVDANEALGTLVGAPVADLIGGRCPWRNLHTRTVDERVGPMLVAELVPREGAPIPVELRLSYLQLGPREVRLFVVRDLRGQVEAERVRRSLREQLAQASKMEAIGRLAGGVAHDFNNLLTVIIGNTELLCAREEEGSENGQLLEEIAEAGQRARTLTRQLLAFGRKQMIHPVPTDFNAMVHGDLQVLDRLLGEDVDVQFRPCLDPTPVLADAEQLRQVVSNLMLNARDATLENPRERPRRIRVQTRIVYDPPQVPAPGVYVALEVEDNGVGMDEGLRQRVFEPFFTTKGFGSGTGLGLSTLLGIVQQNLGAVEVQSQQGQGSTFTVFWPRRAAEGAGAGEQAGGPKAPSSLVMLVEDEPAVRDFAARALRNLGLSVQPFSGGEEALRWVTEQDGRPDLVLTDVVMPGMNGAALAEALRGIRPELPILFMSGYTDDIVARHGVILEGTALLEKPFSIADLGRAVRAALAGVGAPVR